MCMQLPKTFAWLIVTRLLDIDYIMRRLCFTPCEAYQQQADEDRLHICAHVCTKGCFGSQHAHRHCAKSVLPVLKKLNLQTLAVAQLWLDPT